MSNVSKILLKVFAVFSICIVAVVTLFATGIIEAPVFLDIYSDKQYEQTSTASKTPETKPSQNNTNNNTVTITTSKPVDINSVPSALNIKLSGDYLTAFNKAIKTLPSDDLKSQVLIKVGLQILQSKTIKYRNALHFYSLDYTNSCSIANRKTYSLIDAIRRINAKDYIYTDCFGFVRLTHSIAAYTLNNDNPEAITGISGLYGYRGAYSQGSSFNSMQKLKSGAVVYDCLTGSGTGERHVAMYLYTSGSDIMLMDESGLRVGTFKSGSYIYSSQGTNNPYKFNKFKNYN